MSDRVTGTTAIWIRGYTVARKKKGSPYAPLVLLFFQLLGAIVLLITFLAVFALIGAWLYFEWAIKQYTGIRGPQDIKLPPQDRRTLDEYIAAKTRIDKRLAEIDAQRRALPLRKDGSFDNRNKEGRALNTELQTLRADLEECERIIENLSGWEERTYNRWANTKSGLFASRIAMVSLPVGMLGFYLIKPEFALSLSTFMERTSGLPTIGGVDGIYGIFSATAGLSTILFFVLWGLSRAIAPR